MPAKIEGAIASLAEWMGISTQDVEFLFRDLRGEWQEGELLNAILLRAVDRGSSIELIQHGEPGDPRWQCKLDDWTAGGATPLAAAMNAMQATQQRAA
jgi:hypothetical protein